MSNNRNRNRNRQGGQNTRALAGADGKRQFTFKHKDKVFVLPPAISGQENMEAGVLMDAVLDDQGGIGELRLGFATLKASNPDPKALEALRAKPIPECMEILTRWMTDTGTSPGESERSSN